MSTQEKLEEVKEKLAAIEHERWADWQKWMHNQLTPELCIPYELWERWQKQIITPYKDLPEHSKQSDRDQVERYWPIIQALIDSAKREVLEQIRPPQATIDSMKLTQPHKYRGVEYPCCSICGFCPEAINAFIDSQLEQSEKSE